MSDSVIPKNYPASQIRNLTAAEKIVTKAISENIPNSFKYATDEQIKKMLVNIVANFITTASIDGGEWD